MCAPVIVGGEEGVRRVIDAFLQIRGRAHREDGLIARPQIQILRNLQPERGIGIRRSIGQRHIRRSGVDDGELLVVLIIPFLNGSEIQIRRIAGKGIIKGIRLQIRDRNDLRRRCGNRIGLLRNSILRHRCRPCNAFLCSFVPVLFNNRFLPIRVHTDIMEHADRRNT